MTATAIEYVPKEDAKVVRQRKTAVVEKSLSELVQEHGYVSQQMILDAAQDEKHPLHKYFEWDDTEAARKWRLAQALQMIMATRFVCFLNKDRKAKKVESVVKESRKAVQVRRLLPSFTGDGFRERADVLGDDEARKSLVERKLSVLRSWCSSVIDIDELSPIREGLLELLA